MKDKYGDKFEYEISCDQMCGSGHYTMRGLIVVETQAEYDKWFAQQTPIYVSTMQQNSPPPAQAPDSAANAGTRTTMR
jgi:cytochrome c oxidase subunit 2